jgi:hypothetical protein
MARLGDLLVAMGLATEEQRARAFMAHRRQGGRIGTALLESGVPEGAVATALGTQHGIPPARGSDVEEIRPDVLRLVPLRTAQRLGVVPFRREGRLLFVAMKDPHDLRTLDEVRLATGLDVRPFVAVEARIETALAKHYGARVEPRLVAAIRLNALRTASEADVPEPPEQSTAPRKARPATLRVVHPPPFVVVPGETGPAPPEAPAPRRAPARDRSDPWSSTDTRLVAALARPGDADVLEDDVRPAAPEPARRPTPPVPPPVDPVPDRPGPTIEERLAGTLGDARTNEDVVEAVLAAASRYVRRAALFVIDGEFVAAWGAIPEPETDVRDFRLPLSEASVFATLRDTEGFYVGPYMDLPSTVQVLKALGSDGLGTMAVVPVTLKRKTVLYLWGESESYTRPPSVPALKRLAAMLATGLELVRLKSRLYTF